MKYQKKEGCLIKALESGEINVIGHQANCFNVMKRGVASALSKRWVAVERADCSTIKGSKKKLGTMTYALVPEGIIFNLYGQYHWDKEKPLYGTNYEALNHSLILMKKHLEGIGPKKIGFPLIGCGLAGGDWDVVEKLINNTFNDTEHSITIYTL